MEEDVEFRLLVVGDIHYTSDTDAATHPRRRREMAAELLHRALLDAGRLGGFDAIAVMGDICDTADHVALAGDLQTIKAVIDKVAPAVPVLVVPGNHDQPDAVAEVFDCRPGVRPIAGYRFVTFIDTYAEGDFCTRSRTDRQLLADVAGQAGGPIIVLQHNPMNPAVADDYPYMLTNRDEVLADYAQGGVLLSISGHYHPGQSLNFVGGVNYFTAGALCESPFQFSVVTFRGRAVDVRMHTLKLPADLPLVDCHTHTEFAYCGEGVSGAGNAFRAELLGLGRVCLVEHAPQLYCGEDDFYAAAYVRNPSIWRSGQSSRMAAYREKIVPLKSDRVLVGLEVELDCEGRLTLLDEDRAWCDLLVGAVHFLTEEHKQLSDRRLEELWLATTLGLLQCGVDILAHPWRYFQWAKRTTPKRLYSVLAEELAAADVAAEINLHRYVNDPEFLAACVAAGVKIAFGSDSHEPHQVAALTGQLAILRQAVGRDDVADLLWQPRK